MVMFAKGFQILATYSKQFRCPPSSVHNSDGSISIKRYGKYKWQSKLVHQYHQEILQSRANDEGNKNNGGYQS
eukprot:6328384-Ditylum_brightwellii.AAC.1